MRIVDARGVQVPWRPFPPSPASVPRRVPLLDVGRSGGAVVALLDLGPHAGVHDHVDLDLPGQNFVGIATVSGSNDRSTFTELGTARVFDLRNVRRTDLAFSPSDFRYLRLNITGVTRIDGATISGHAPTGISYRVPWRPYHGQLDLGGANVPVDSIRITASNGRYDRRVTVEARNPGGPWRTVADSRIFRLHGTSSPPIELATSARYLRVLIVNGSDPPLAGVRVQPLARPRTILVEGGHREPLRIVYGGRSRAAPDYEFARLPRDTLDLSQLRRGSLGAPERNAAYEAAPDTRSWVSRHGLVVDAALALAAAVVGFGGFLALRRRA